jgi:PAS domain S-box-containing protein
MDFNIIKARGSNKILGMLIAFQLALLLVIGILLVQLLTNQVLPFSTIFSSVFLILICMPLSLFLYVSAPDSTQKKIFLSFAVSFGIMTLSGILWDIVPMVFPGLDLVSLAKSLSVLSYVPFIVMLVYVLRTEPVNVQQPVKALIATINVAVATIILLLVAIRLSGDSGNAFDAAIYTSSTIADIVIFSLCSILALNYMQNQLRYAFMIMLVFFFLSLAGDSLSLLGALGWQGFPGLVQLIWDIMFVLTAIALIVFALSRNMDVTTVEEINRKLHDTRSRMERLILQSPDAICIFDASGDAMMANSAFMDMIGEKPSDGQGTINIFRDLGQIISGSADLARIRDGGTFTFEGMTMAGTGDSPVRYYHVLAFPTYGAPGEITGYIVIMVDITERKKYEEELINARTQAELYLDLMSHDINNMNQIGIGFLEMALDRLHPDNEGQMLIRKPLEAMLNSSHLIDNVKKIRRANTGSFCLEPVDLCKTLDEVIRDYQDIPGRDAMIEYAPAEGYYVLANPLLKDVFSNLVNNAFKHSTGPLKIWVKVSPVNSDQVKCYQVTVEDNGPGIPKDARRVLLEQAYSFKKRAGGGGLGLYLVKVLVDSFKGTIAVEDRVPGDARPGTRITITLPAADVAPGVAETPPCPVTENSPGHA